MGEKKQMRIDRALIVDDDEISRFLIEYVLKQLGVASEIIPIRNGKEAVDFYKNHETHYPELVILDISMPILNGFEFLDWYERNGLKGKSKFIILTSSERGTDKDKSREYSDIVSYISKPLTKKNIEEVVLQLA